MTDENAAVVARPGWAQPAAWYELVRFGLVGTSGYFVNLLVFTALFHGAGTGHKTAATGAFVVALTNNFLWNRLWTFRARDGHAGFQAARFVVVSLLAFCLNIALLELFVLNGFAGVPAQAVAIIAATPLSFLGNKLWSFRL